MPLTFAQKSAIRRHLDYPVVGLMKVSPAGGSLGSPSSGYRFFQAYGRLEYKMNNLNPDEEARLVGLAYGAVALVGPNPNVGDQIGFILSGGAIASPQLITATAQGGDSPATLVLRLAAATAGNTVLQAASLLAISPFGTGAFNQNEMPLAELGIEAPVAFTIGGCTGTGSMVPQVTATGTFLPPKASVDGTTQVWGYLAILDALEEAWAGSSQNLDTSKAGPWTSRGNEAGQRLSLYKNWQVRLSRFLEIPIYNGTPEGTRSGYTAGSRYA